jgi:hypothetical protein
MLQLSSCLFATVVVHAYAARNAWVHHGFLALTLTSVLFHTTHEERWRVLDKGLAHLVFALVALDAPRVLAGSSWWILAFPLGTLACWGAECLLNEGRGRDRVHLALHLVSLAGMHAYLRV